MGTNNMVTDAATMAMRFKWRPPPGSACKQGEAESVAIYVAANTFFGRAVSLVGQDDGCTLLLPTYSRDTLRLSVTDTSAFFLWLTSWTGQKFSTVQFH